MTFVLDKTSESFSKLSQYLSQPFSYTLPLSILFLALKFKLFFLGPGTSLISVTSSIVSSKAILK